MDKQPTFKVFVMTVLKRSFVAWHGGEAWVAFTAYATILLLPLLVTGQISRWTDEAISKAVEQTIATIAVLWLVVLVVVIVPFQLWRELVNENAEQKDELDTRARRLTALEALGTVWEDATHYLNDVAQKGVLDVNVGMKLRDYENEIYDVVGKISPGEVSTFRTIGSFAKTDHPSAYQTSNWGGDNRLVIFSERLLRVRKFIDKHSPPSS